MELTERFADLFGRAPFPLDEACAVISAHGDADCDVDAVLEQLDDLAGLVPGPTLEQLLLTLFADCGFAGDEEDYYDPRNSYLHAVVRRRRGLPITLSVVLMEVGRRVGVALDGIGTPAHFVVRTSDEPYRFVDAFDRGLVLDRAGLDERFAARAPGIDIGPFLHPLPGQEIVRRVLGNLVAVHRRRGDRDGLRWSTELRTLIPGSDADDRRIFGGALAACGDFARAAKVLESIVDEGQAADPQRELAEAQRLRARLN